MTEVILADSELGIGSSARRSKASTAARQAAKTGLRTFATATASHRDGPDVVVIGSKRGGTTSVSRQLSEHPGFLPLFPARQKIKGTYYFADRFDESPAWFQSHFPTRATRAIAAGRLGHRTFSVDASPYYLSHPLAAQRAAATCPEAIFVAVLRDPVERAFSHWKERRANGTEPLPFYEALLAESVRVGDAEQQLRSGQATSIPAHRQQTYLGQSRYAAAIDRWKHAVGDQLVVWVSEEFHADTAGHLNSLFGRLSLPPVASVDDKAYNAHPGAELDDRARAFLEHALADDVRALETVLGRPLPWLDQWQSASASAGAR